jgi:hypothetical protein
VKGHDDRACAFHESLPCPGRPKVPPGCRFFASLRMTVPASDDRSSSEPLCCPIGHESQALKCPPATLKSRHAGATPARYSFRINWKQVDKVRSLCRCCCRETHRHQEAPRGPSTCTADRSRSHRSGPGGWGGLFAGRSGPAFPGLSLHRGEVRAALPQERHGRTGRQLLPAPFLPALDRCGAHRRICGSGGGVIPVSRL